MTTIALERPVRTRTNPNPRKKSPIKAKRRRAKRASQEVYLAPVRRKTRWIVEFRAALREEIANCLTHGIGAGLSIAGMAFLITFAAKQGDPWKIVSFSIYGGCMIILYLASTLYHAFLSPRAKKVFKVLDHSAIFLAIAGSYTPFTLVSLRASWGSTLFVIVWIFAGLGVLFKVFFVNRFRLISVGVYILMGWLALVAVRPMLKMVPTGGLVWIAIGGLAYTIGTAFYASRKPLMHMVWHLFVLVGSICHYMAVWFYVLPA